MPITLPDVSSLGGLPNAASGRPIASYDTTALGAGIAKAGQGAEQGAGQLLVALRYQERAQNLFQTAQAEAKLQNAEFPIREQVARATDPNGLAQNTGDAYDKAISDAAQSISDPEHRQLFIDRSQTRKAQLNFDVDNRAFDLTKQNAIAGADQTLEDLRSNAVQSKDQSYRDAAPRTAATLIDGLAAKGYIDPVTAGKVKRDWVAKYAEGSVAAEPDPVKRLALLNQGGGGAAPVPGSFADTVTKAAQAHGLDPKLLLGMAKIESSSGSDTSTSSAGAEGPFQFVPSTAKQYGLTNPQDVAQSADAAARYAVDNKKALASALGREPTNGEIYLAHQQGAAGAIKLLQNPDTNAASLVGAKAITGNGGAAGMTAGQFADHWTSRFGGSDSGSSSGAAGPGSIADLIPPDRRQALIQDAERAIHEQSTQAAAEQKKAVEVQFNDLMNGITDGKAGNIDVQNARDAGWLTDHSQITSALDAIKRRDNEAIDAGTAIQHLQDPAYTYNGFDPKSAKEVDLAYKALGGSQGLLDGDQRAAVTLGALVNRTGMVPLAAMQALRQAEASNNPAVVAAGAHVAAGLYASNPQIFEASTDGPAVRDLGIAFSHLVNDRGMSSAEAAQHIIDGQKPENIRAERELAVAATAFVSKLDIADVTGSLRSGGGWFGIGSTTPAAGYTNSMKTAMQADYQEIAREKFTDPHSLGYGDAGTAKTLATQEMGRLYGVSTVSGTPTLMKYPPEMNYPPIDGSTDYLKGAALHQAAEDFKARGFPVEIGPSKKARADESAAAAEGHAGILQARLIPTPVTAQDINDHVLPRYELQYSHLVDGQEVWETAKGGAFTAPVEQLRAAAEAVKAKSDEKATTVEATRQQNISASETSRAARLKASAPVDLAASESQPPLATPAPTPTPAPVPTPAPAAASTNNPLRRPALKLPTVTR